MIWTLLFLFISTSWAQELVVNSTPTGSLVIVSSLDGKDRKQAGETPFKINLEELSRNLIRGAEMMVIEVVKDGYEPYRVLIPKFLKSEIKLDVLLTQRSDWENIKAIDNAISSLLEAQRRIRSQNIDGALAKIKEVEQVLPKLSVTKELAAGAHFLKKDFKTALDLYQQAFAANTSNTDAYKMIKYLEKAMGIPQKAEGP